MQKLLVEDVTSVARVHRVQTVIVVLKRRKSPSAENMKAKWMPKRMTRVARVKTRRFLGKKPKRSMMPDLRERSRSG
jgi:hypothetical protein